MYNFFSWLYSLAVSGYLSSSFYPLLLRDVESRSRTCFGLGVDILDRRLPLLRGLLVISLWQ